MTLDFDADDVACLPGRHSQIARLLRALANFDGRPVAVRWDRRRRFVTILGRRAQGGGTEFQVHDSQLMAARRAGWVTPAADPPDGTWMLTESGRAVLEAL